MLRNNYRYERFLERNVVSTYWVWFSDAAPVNRICSSTAILIFIPLVIGGIFWWFFGTAPERIAKRTLREQEARVRTEEATIERERNAELLKQIKDNEYAGRRQLRAEIEKNAKIFKLEIYYF